MPCPVESVLTAGLGDDFREVDAVAKESHAYRVDARRSRRTGDKSTRATLSCSSSIASVLGEAEFPCTVAIQQLDGVMDGHQWRGQP